MRLVNHTRVLQIMQDCRGYNRADIQQQAQLHSGPRSRRPARSARPSASGAVRSARLRARHHLPSERSTRRLPAHGLADWPGLRDRGPDAIFRPARSARPWAHGPARSARPRAGHHLPARSARPWAHGPARSARPWAHGPARSARPRAEHHLPSGPVRGKARLEGAPRQPDPGPHSRVGPQRIQPRLPKMRKRTSFKHSV